MNFEELHALIPYAKGGKEKVLRFSPYPNITIAMPGRHAHQTDPVGGDFVVMVNDPIYPNSEHQFKHKDIFKDIEAKAAESTRPGLIDGYMEDYLYVIKGGDPEMSFTTDYDKAILTGIHPQTFLYAVQCLAVAEHRRYARYEKQFGGRYLPFRFAAGIAQGLWTTDEASELEKKGRPGVEQLERTKGRPKLTQELMGYDD